MRVPFSALFGLGGSRPQVPVGADTTPTPPPMTADDCRSADAGPAPIGTQRHPPAPTGTENEFFHHTWFLPTQLAWIRDHHHLRIWEKSRQVGATKTDAFDSVMKASPAEARFDVWVTSRDEFQARLYLEDSKEWASILHLAATDLGLVVLDQKRNFSAHVLQFANGRRIYCLSSNPNALAGKRGHVKIDEFALHPDQRLLYRIAKPVTQWGGTLSIISTHRGVGTLFNQIITGIRHDQNPMGWHLHSYPVQKAVQEGIVEKINQKSERDESPDAFLARIRAECIDEEQWLQEYCCTPADENSAFLPHDLISYCEDHNLKLLSFDGLCSSLSPLAPNHQLYLGIDVARKDNLCVIDVGAKIGDVMWDRMRIELHNKPFSEIEFELYRLLRLSQLKRACIDASGMGMQLAERARERFGWRVEPVTFTAAVKEELAFGLRRDFEDRRLRIPRDDKLRADLRGLRKETTASGNIRFGGEADDSHCDRTWAKALRQHAARARPTLTARLG